MWRSRAAEGPIGRCRKSTAPRVQRARLHCAPWADPRCGTCATPMRAQSAHPESADLESVAWAISYIGLRTIRPGPGRRVLHARTSECVGVRNGVLHCARRGRVPGGQCRNARCACFTDVRRDTFPICDSDILECHISRCAHGATGKALPL